MSKLSSPIKSGSSGKRKRFLFNGNNINFVWMTDEEFEIYHIDQQFLRRKLFLNRIFEKKRTQMNQEMNRRFHV